MPVSIQDGRSVYGVSAPALKVQDSIGHVEIMQRLSLNVVMMRTIMGFLRASPE